MGNYQNKVIRYEDIEKVPYSNSSIRIVGDEIHIVGKGIHKKHIKLNVFKYDEDMCFLMAYEVPMRRILNVEIVSCENINIYRHNGKVHVSIARTRSMN